jgi:DNA polymerase-3 subunit epsilon
LFYDIERFFFTSTHALKLVNSFDRLAFVDLETSGLSPDSDRITEVGVVCVDANGETTEWATFINPGRRISERSRWFNGIADETVADSPRFKDIALELQRRLAGRLFVAHNARFDFSFLRAEFERVGIAFQPQVLCSVMLSRKLYPTFAHHDLDTLMQRHGLASNVRHRALPDAQLLWQFWEVMCTEHQSAHLSATVEALLAGPVLPAHLDPSLIERLPEAPGVYVLYSKEGPVMHVGRADNLKRHVRNYFRIDRTSVKALAMSQSIANITWQVTQGPLGSRLRRAQLAKTLLPRKRSRVGIWSWALKSDTYPCMELIELTNARPRVECYGLFNSPRKARNALQRLAAKHGLCHRLLGIAESGELSCPGCIRGLQAGACASKAARLRHLICAHQTLQPLRISQWPYNGPVAVRERRDLHVIEDWHYLGTAKSEAEVHSVLESRSPVFDEDIFTLLSKALPRLPRKRIIALPRVCETVEPFAYDN